MSGIAAYHLHITSVNTKLWGRNGQSPHSIVHPKHPMRLCETIQVQSLKEMKQTLNAGMTIVNTIGSNRYFSYLLDITREKILADHQVYDEKLSIFKIANTVLTTEEFLRTENALDALLGSLRLALDAIEAQIWYLIFTGGYVFLPPIITTGANFSYREVFALGRAAVHRVAGTENVHALVPILHYAAMLMDNSTGITPTQQSGATEHHLYDTPRVTIIPVAHNTNYLINNVTNTGDIGLHERIPFYPDYLPSLFTRYVYEEVLVERVSETSSERNQRRVVLGRYFMYEIPTAYTRGGAPAMPVVQIPADQALNNTINKFSNGFQNISAIASF